MTSAQDGRQPWGTRKAPAPGSAKRSLSLGGKDAPLPVSPDAGPPVSVVTSKLAPAGRDLAAQHPTVLLSSDTTAATPTVEAPLPQDGTPPDSAAVDPPVSSGCCH